ncbi:hypothetical protein CRN74_17160 [Yersinia frederiksenii]|jgi:hypothetical protein|nr:hypothetical protein CRN74_17160 [Yersinia frederiksenii]
MPEATLRHLTGLMTENWLNFNFFFITVISCLTTNKYQHTFSWKMKIPFKLVMVVKYSVATGNALWLNSVIGLEHRPYESSFSKAVLSSSVILDIPSP